MSELGSVPLTTLIVILGAKEFPHSSNLDGHEAFESAARRMVNYFLSTDGFGLDMNNLSWQFDSEADPGYILGQIHDFIVSRTKTLKAVGLMPTDLILYYVGHGDFDERDQYYLAIRATDDRNKGATGLLLHSLATTIMNSARWLRVTLILDACWSAAAARSFMGAAQEVLRRSINSETFPTRGLSLLAASPKDRPTSVAPDGRTTKFTAALELALRHGSERHPQDCLTLRNLRDLVIERLRELYVDNFVIPEIQSPNQSGGSDVADTPLFPNYAVLNARRVAQEAAEGRKVEDAERQLAKLKAKQQAEEEKRRHAREVAEQKRKSQEAELKRLVQEEAERNQAQEAEADRRAREEAEKFSERDLDPELIDHWLQAQLRRLDVEYYSTKEQIEVLEGRNDELRTFIRNLSENIPISRHKGYSRRMLQPLYEDRARHRRQLRSNLRELDAMQEKLAGREAERAVYRGAISGDLRQTILKLRGKLVSKGISSSFSSIVRSMARAKSEQAESESRKQARWTRIEYPVLLSTFVLLALLWVYLVVFYIPWATPAFLSRLPSMRSPFYAINLVGTILLLLVSSALGIGSSFFLFRKDANKPIWKQWRTVLANFYGVWALSNLWKIGPYIWQLLRNEGPSRSLSKAEISTLNFSFINSLLFVYFLTRILFAAFQGYYQGYIEGRRQ